MKTSVIKTKLLFKTLLFSLLFIFYASFCFAQGLAFYGMTSEGGPHAAGNIFKYNPTTNTFTNLVDFGAAPFYGNQPRGNLIKCSDGNLYGMTSRNIFKYNPATTVFVDLVDFTGDTGAYLGANPYGSLIQASDGNLYGMTHQGGAGNNGTGFGTIFKYSTATGTFTNLVNFTGGTGAYIGGFPQGNLIEALDGKLYGMTFSGGANLIGNIFKYDPATSAFTDLLDFTGDTGAYLGKNPSGSLMQASDGNLYGMTQSGGNSGGTGIGLGNIFKYDPATSVFTDLVDFTTGGAYPGTNPQGNLIQASDGNLYGLTSVGGGPVGQPGYGNIFKYDFTTSTFTNLVDFTGDTGGIYPGNQPYGNLIQASDGNLYATTLSGGTTHGDGNIFKYNPTTAAFTDMVEFTGGAGAYTGDGPLGDLLEDTDYATGINNISASSLFINIYPDPNTGYFTVMGLTQGQVIELYNCTGQRIESKIADNTTMDFNIAAYASGMYLVRIQNQDGSIATQTKMVKTQ